MPPLLENPEPTTSTIRKGTTGHGISRFRRLQSVILVCSKQQKIREDTTANTCDSDGDLTNQSWIRVTRKTGTKQIYKQPRRRTAQIPREPFKTVEPIPEHTV